VEGEGVEVLHRILTNILIRYAEEHEGNIKGIMKMNTVIGCTLILFSGCALSALAFTSEPQQQPKLARSSNSFRLHVVDPATLGIAAAEIMNPATFGIAAASAIAGASSQIPKIQHLEQELESAREALTASENQLVSQIAELEEKIFTIDKEYEAQTDKFKKQYDETMRDKLAATKEKMKVDFGYKLEIRLEEEKAKMLQENLGVVNTLTAGKRQEKLAELKFQNSRVELANSKLEKALAQSKVELERLQHAGKGRGWWPF